MHGIKSKVTKFLTGASVLCQTASLSELAVIKRSEGCAILDYLLLAEYREISVPKYVFRRF